MVQLTEFVAGETPVDHLVDCYTPEIWPRDLATSPPKIIFETQFSTFTFFHSLLWQILASGSIVVDTIATLFRPCQLWIAALFRHGIRPKRYRGGQNQPYSSPGCEFISKYMTCRRLLVCPRHTPMNLFGIFQKIGRFTVYAECMILSSILECWYVQDLGWEGSIMSLWENRLTYWLCNGDDSSIHQASNAKRTSSGGYRWPNW